MASIIRLRRRIKTAKSISQITRAMEMVAASKMNRAREKVTKSRPYAEKLSLITSSLSTRVEPEQTHQFFLEQKGGLPLLIVVSPDRGLCGSLITNLAREFLIIKKENLKQKDIIVVTVGRKLQQKIVKMKINLIADFPFGTSLPSFETALQLRSLVSEGFLNGQFSEVFCLYTRFETVFTQKPTLKKILPIQIQSLISEAQSLKLPYLFEPDALDILESILPHYLEMQLFQMLLESYASEQAARMTAMHSATENAKEVVDILTLEYNKERQARITNEILDIVTATRSIGL